MLVVLVRVPRKKVLKQQASELGVKKKYGVFASKSAIFDDIIAVQRAKSEAAEKEVKSLKKKGAEVKKESRALEESVKRSKERARKILEKPEKDALIKKMRGQEAQFEYIGIKPKKGFPSDVALAESPLDVLKKRSENYDRVMQKKKFKLRVRDKKADERIRRTKEDISTASKQAGSLSMIERKAIVRNIKEQRDVLERFGIKLKEYDFANMSNKELSRLSEGLSTAAGKKSAFALKHGAKEADVLSRFEFEITKRENLKERGRQREATVKKINDEVDLLRNLGVKMKKQNFSKMSQRELSNFLKIVQEEAEEMLTADLEKSL